MSLKFTNYNDFIIIESSTGMDFLEILEGLPQLLLMPEFEYKNDIWVFGSGQIKMSYTDLYTIKDLVEKTCSKNFAGAKTAIVAENGFQQSLGKLYSDICKDLGREIRVFSELESAKEWIVT